MMAKFLKRFLLGLAAAAGLLAAGCEHISIRENRYDCPGRLFVERGDTVPDGGLSLLVVDPAGAAVKSLDGVFVPGAPDTLEFDLEGGTHRVVSWFGGSLEGSVLVPASDAPLWAGVDSAAVNPDFDSHVSAKAFRQSMRLSVRLLSGGLPYEGPVPEITVSGASGALSTPSLLPVAGPAGGFSSVMDPAAPDYFSAWVSRQRGDSLSLLIALGDSSPFVADAGALLRALGYDWGAASLADAEVTVDLAPVAVEEVSLPEFVAEIGLVRVPLMRTSRVTFGLAPDGSAPLRSDGSVSEGTPVALYGDEDAGLVFFAALDSLEHTVYVFSDGVAPGKFTLKCGQPSPEFSSHLYEPDPLGEPLTIRAQYPGLPETGSLTDAATRAEILSGGRRLDSQSALAALDIEVRSTVPVLVYEKTLDLPDGEEGTIRLDVSDFESAARLFGTSMTKALVALSPGGLTLDAADVHVGVPELGPIVVTEVHSPKYVGEIGYVRGEFSSLRNFQFATNPGYMRPFSGGADEMADMILCYDAERETIFFTSTRQGPMEFRLRADFTSGAQYPQAGSAAVVSAVPTVWLDALSYTLPADGSAVEANAMREGVFELGSIADDAVHARVLAGESVTDSSVYSRVLTPSGASAVDGILVSGTFPSFRLRIDTSKGASLYGRTFQKAFFITYSGQSLDKPVYFPTVAADIVVGTP